MAHLIIIFMYWSLDPLFLPSLSYGRSNLATRRTTRGVLQVCKIQWLCLIEGVQNMQTYMNVSTCCSEGLV